MFGFTFGVLSLGISFHWAPESLAYILDAEGVLPYLAFLGLILWESIPFGMLAGAFVWVSQFRRPPIFVLPFLWVVTESFWPKVFPWSFAQSHTGFLPVLQVAEIGGTALVAFALVSVWIAIAQIIVLTSNRFREKRNSAMESDVSASQHHIRKTDNRFHYFQLGLLGAIFAFALLFGWIRIGQNRSETRPLLRIAMAQVDPSFQTSLSEMQKMSIPFAEQTDLFLWPESSIGCHSIDLKDFKDDNLVRSSSLPPYIDSQYVGLPGKWLIVGGRTFSSGATESGPFCQTAFLINPQGNVVDHYHKRALMPIGEYVPLEQTFPIMHTLVPLPEVMLPGTSDDPLVVDKKIRVGMLICYEDTVADIARRSVNAGANCLMCIINASAFSNPLTLRQHLRLAQMRAIETRRYFARCAGTGISCVISDKGKIMTQLGANESGVLQGELRLRSDATFYCQAGYLFPWLCLVVVALSFVALQLTKASRLGGA